MLSKRWDFLQYKQTINPGNLSPVTDYIKHPICMASYKSITFLLLFWIIWHSLAELGDKKVYHHEWWFAAVLNAGHVGWMGNGDELGWMGIRFHPFIRMGIHPHASPLIPLRMNGWNLIPIHPHSSPFPIHPTCSVNETAKSRCNRLMNHPCTKHLPSYLVSIQVQT